MQALWACIKSLLAAHDTLQERVRQSTFSYGPHPGLAALRQQLTARIDSNLAARQYSAATPDLHALGQLAEDSLQYLQRYHWKALYATILACYALWALALVLHLLRQQAAAAGAAQAPRAQRVALTVVATLSAASAAALLPLRLPVRSTLRVRSWHDCIVPAASER